MKHIQDEQRFFNDLFDMLEAHCGKDMELVLHNLSVRDDDYNHTIVDIRNGHITNRKVGDWGDEDGLQILRGMLDVSDSYNEFMHTEAGHILRCSSMYKVVVLPYCLPQLIVKYFPACIYSVMIASILLLISAV